MPISWLTQGRPRRPTWLRGVLAQHSWLPCFFLMRGNHPFEILVRISFSCFCLSFLSYWWKKNLHVNYVTWEVELSALLSLAMRMCTGIVKTRKQTKQAFFHQRKTNITFGTLLISLCSSLSVYWFIDSWLDEFGDWTLHIQYSMLINHHTNLSSYLYQW